MRWKADCDRCGSAGSIQFDLCQVCLKDYAGGKDRPVPARASALALEIDQVLTRETRTMPLTLTRESALS